MNLATQEDFSKFGKSFQENLCKMILEDRPFSDQIGEILDVNFFELRYLQVFCKKIYDYKQKYNIHPSNEIMTTIIRTELKDEEEVLQKQTRDYFARIQSQQNKTDGQEYIKDTALDFCKKQKLKEAIGKSIKLLSKNSSSFDEIRVLINEALRLGADNNFGYDYIKDFEERFLIKARNPVTTGWSQIDKICSGGLGGGELGVCVAPTGAGKSMILVHLGSEALKQGKTVIHYTLELRDTVVARRYDSCITGYELSSLVKKKAEVLDVVKDIEGTLIVKEYPTKSASVNTFKSHLKRLQLQGIEPDLVIVDYGDLVRPSVIRKEKRIELECIYEDLRGMAQEFDCPIWTASQTNRSGLNAEIITMESISEAFNKCFVSDFIFTLSRTIEDKNTNSGRIFVAKNRNGPDGLIYPIFMDTSNVAIRVLQQNQETDSIMQKSSKDRLQDLKDRYKEFRKEKN
jgi:replicative DNA helicase